MQCPLRAAPALPPSIRELVLVDITQTPTTFTGFLFTSNLPALEKLHLSGLTFDLLEVERLLDGIDGADHVTQYPKLKMLGLTGVYTGFWPDGRAQQTQLLTHSRLRNIEELVLNLNTDIVVDDMIAQIVSGELGPGRPCIERTKPNCDQKPSSSYAAWTCLPRGSPVLASERLLLH
jgi:hypothetical protein